MNNTMYQSVGFKKMNRFVTPVVTLAMLLQLLGGAFSFPVLAYAEEEIVQPVVTEEPVVEDTLVIEEKGTTASEAEETSSDPGSSQEESPNSLDVLASVFVETTVETSVEANVRTTSSNDIDDSHDDPKYHSTDDTHKRVTLRNVPVEAGACTVGSDTGGVTLGSGEMLWHFVLTNSKTDHQAILHVAFGDTTQTVSPTSVNNGVQHFYVQTASGVTLTDAYVTNAVAKHGKKMKLTLSHCVFGSDVPPPPAQMATISATKIVCDSESDLPNWGTGGPDITADTASQFLATHPNCRAESGWKFQSAPASTPNPGDMLIGEAGAPWSTSPATDASGKTTWMIPVTGSSVWVREVLRDGFVGFTYGANNRTNADSVSAEMYCHTDVLNYDNYDAITSLVPGKTYYCIAFNAPKSTINPSACPFTAGAGNYVIEYGTAKKIVSNSTHSAANVMKSVSIPPGVYEVSLYSYDSYPTRGSVSQPREEWYLRLSDQNTALVAASGAIGDLEDYVVTATKNQYVGDVTLSRPVTSAMAKHAAWPDTSSPNSLYPICAQLRLKETPNLPPVITVNLPNPQIVLQGDAFVDLGATAQDPEDGDITAQISASGFVDTTTVGTYTITYTVSDSKGLAAEPKTRTVMVVPRPVVCAEPSVLGDTVVNTPKASGEKTVKQIMEENGIFLDPSVSGREYQTWALSKDVTDIEVTYLGGVAGSKRAFGFYRDSDKSGFVGVFKANAHTAYPSLPTLSVGDTVTISVTKGTTGKLGFALDVELSGRKVYATENALNHDAADHVLVYEIAQGDYVLAFEDVAIPGADEDFNDLVVRVKVTGCRDITVISQCSDSIDNDGDTKTDYPLDLGCESATDDDENDRPVITVTPPNPSIVSIGTTFTDPGATAFDAEDGDITAQISASGFVDTTTVGTYTITYTVSDSKGLAAEPKTRTVTVVSQCSDGVDNDGDTLTDYPADPGCEAPNDDTENARPVITVLGDNPVTIVVGTAFVDPGATAFDAEDGDIPVTSAGSVDVGTVGTYTITYTAQDSQGLAAEPKTRTVNVVPSSGCTVNCGGGSTPPACANGGDDDGDGLADYPADPGCSSSNDNDERDGGPTLILLGSNPLSVTQGSTFTDPGATASDPEDGDITSRISVSGSVNTAVIGSYVLTYSVTDTSGNAATPVTRTVNVVPGGGGGGGGSAILVITNEKLTKTENSGEVVITWNTNLPATSRVVYGTASVTMPGSAPLYGYTTSNATDTTLVHNHSMTVTGLVEGVSYYFRPVSTESTQSAVGIELVMNQQPPTSCVYLKEYLRYGQPNNPEEVMKLQSFLKSFEGFSNLAVSGFFDLETDAAVRAFQDKYAAEVLAPWNLPGNTGYVYYTTQKKINEIYCQRAFPLNDMQISEIEAYKRLLENLRRSGVVDSTLVPVVGSTGGVSVDGNGLAAGDPDTTAGEVAGLATQEGTLTTIGTDEQPGVLARGRIALADLLATVPNLGDKLRGTSNSATITDSVASSETEDVLASVIDATSTSRVEAAVGYMKNLGSCTWVAWTLFLIVLILLVMYLRLWLMHRKESVEEPVFPKSK